jgi:hypothetical protein
MQLITVLLTGKYLVVPDNTTFHHCLYAVDNMYLFGTGTIKMQPNSYYNVDAIYIEDKKNITIEGIEIVGDLVGHTREASEMWNYWQWLIYADGVDGLTIKDCNIHDSYSMGICVGNLDDAVVNAINKNIIIKNCNVHHNKTNNIAISSAANVIIDGCFVHDVGDVTPRNGIDLETDAYTTEAISQVKIINCIIQNNYKGMEIVNRNTLTHIDVSNNMILDCNTGILLSGGVSANVTDIVIDNNLIKGSSIAIDENYVDYKLTNNKILGLTGTGSYAVKISIENTIVKGNIFEGSVTGNYIECTGSIRAVLIKIDANTFENINAQALIGFDCNYMAITNNLIDHQGCTLTDSIIKISGGGERCIISRNTSLGVPLTVPFINSSVVGASSNIDFNSMNTSSLGIPTNANRHYNMLNGTSSDT